MRKCKACGTRYEPTRPLQTACSLPCAIIQATQARLKKEQKADKAKRESLKPRSQWMKEAQASFNRYIRARDAGQPCISCGRYHNGQIHAGHYLSTGARPELRFDERNVHSQCAPCNNHLSGNITLYRIGLIAKIGLAAVEELEGPHEPKKYSIDDLRIIKATYAYKTKKLMEKESAE